METVNNFKKLNFQAKFARQLRTDVLAGFAVLSFVFKIIISKMRNLILGCSFKPH